MGGAARVRVNCAYDYWHKVNVLKGKPVPFLDVKLYADMMFDLMQMHPPSHDQTSSLSSASAEALG